MVVVGYSGSRSERLRWAAPSTRRSTSISSIRSISRSAPALQQLVPNPFFGNAAFGNLSRLGDDRARPAAAALPAVHRRPRASREPGARALQRAGCCGGTSVCRDGWGAERQLHLQPPDGQPVRRSRTPTRHRSGSALEQLQPRQRVRATRCSTCRIASTSTRRWNCRSARAKRGCRRAAILPTPYSAAGRSPSSGGSRTASRLNISQSSNNSGSARQPRSDPTSSRRGPGEPRQRRRQLRPRVRVHPPVQPGGLDQRARVHVRQRAAHRPERPDLRTDGNRSPTFRKRNGSAGRR